MTLNSRSWIVTHSGTRFHPLAPDPDLIEIGDIAQALSKICVFGGHCWEFYSVAQHSVLVSRACPAEWALEGLLHDAHVAYLGDVSPPLKRFLGYRWRQFAAAVQHAIARKFGLGDPFPGFLRDIEARVTALEADMLMPKRRAGLELPEPISDEFWEDPKTPFQAALEFVQTYKQLAKEREMER